MMPRQHLTPNACLVCRKKRTKCDGQMPCRRCRSRGEECAYEDKKWRTKDHLRSEIERLRNEQRQGFALIRALTNNDPKQWEAVLERLRSDESPDDIADWIYSMKDVPCISRRPSQCLADTGQLDDTPTYTASPFRIQGSLHSDTSSSTRFRTRSFGSLSNHNFSQPFGSFDTTPRTSFSGDLASANRLPFRNHSLVYPPPPSEFMRQRPSIAATPMNYFTPEQEAGQGALTEQIVRTWTSVVSDTRLVQRLFGRFFSGCSTSLCLVPEAQFMKDFREGNTRFCSQALVNAILGRACKFFDANSQLVSRITFGDAFLGEAKRLLSLEPNHVSLPSIQALGVLALTEVSQGNDDAAWELAWESVRASIHLMLQTKQQTEETDRDFRTVRAAAFCGGFSLIRLLRLATGRLEPNTGPLFMKLQSFPEIQGQDVPEVRVERGISLQMQFFAELQYCHPIARFLFEVTEVVHTFASYNFSRAMTAEDLENAYGKCLDYYSQFSESLGVDIDSSPDLLFAQTWYHYCLLCLLRPFVKTTASLKDGTPPRLRHGATAQAICRQSSEAIIFITSTYQTRYSLAQLPSLLPHMVYAAVLYQLTLTTETPCPTPQQAGLAESPAIGITPTNTDSPRNLNIFPPGTQTPSSPAVDVVAPRRRPSVLSASDLSCTSDPTSLSSSAPEKTSSCSEPISDTMLPLFTSEPADLVTIGSLQLASMGASHPDAAEASRLLRSLTAARDLAGAHYDLASLAQTLPYSMDDSSAAMLLTGLGLQRNPEPPPPSPPDAEMFGVAGPEMGCTPPIPAIPAPELPVGQAGVGAGLVET
ncbi:hypothetical protein QBC37DRAFT_91591 [Rhypophila decipiens]|uniref:Zn(2)-C6 fungal-type domain-containing protein n=1 Tax=Rhypophila decipiens TaxID=261697 RepID=A0AAN6YBZ3_9PEZI|nr:hypothetical protein QBC37DRAFT_91591 [Rhypophila decipiens]